MDVYLLSQHFVRCKSYLNIYLMRTSDSFLVLVLYVDVLLIIGILASTIVVVKDILHDMFSMMDMGSLYYFLSLEISQDASNIKLS
jgi:hypothetical protein